MSESRRRPPSAAVIRRREEKIIAWRGEDVKLRVMARRLKMKLSTVGRLAARLISEGRMESRWAKYADRLDSQVARPSPFQERLAARDQQIIALGAEGCSISEIARRLKMSYPGMHRAVHKLVRLGKMPKPQRHWPAYGPKHEEYVATIIKMKKRRATLKQIGDVLGITRERVRQIAVWIVETQGREVFQSDTPLWSAKEAARIVGCSHSIVLRLCRKGVVPCVQDAAGRCRLLDQSNVNALAEWLRTREPVTKTCSNCGVEFSSYGRSTCSDRCYGHLAYLARRQRGPEKATGWRRAVWEALKDYELPASEEWLLDGEAARRAGLTKAQLQYLRETKIVTTNSHPTRRWRGLPCHLYAASQMEIVRRVYQEFQRTNSRHEHLK